MSPQEWRTPPTRAGISPEWVAVCPTDWVVSPQEGAVCRDQLKVRLDEPRTPAGGVDVRGNEVVVQLSECDGWTALCLARLDAPTTPKNFNKGRLVSSITPPGQARAEQSGIEMPHSKKSAAIRHVVAVLRVGWKPMDWRGGCLSECDGWTSLSLARLDEPATPKNFNKGRLVSSITPPGQARAEQSGIEMPHSKKSAAIRHVVTAFRVGWKPMN